jgi:hypothetical protein
LQQDSPTGSDWQTAILNEQDGKQRFHIPDYEVVRTKTHTYVRWKTGERELYDLQKDPYELENVNDKAVHLFLARFKTRLRGCRCSASAGVLRAGRAKDRDRRPAG